MAAARRAAGLWAVLVLLGGASPTGAAELLVGAAVSLRGPMDEIARRFEAREPGVAVRLSFGASSVLASQVRAGAPLDVLVSADERSVEQLASEGRIAPQDRVVLASNRLVVLVAPHLRRRPARPGDLLAQEIRRVAVPDGAVPIGRYARAWLAAQGLLEPLAARLVPTEHARATLAAVDAGHAEAAIVYATDARLARAARPAFEIPDAEQPRIVYAAARLLGARPGAERLLAFLGGDEARRVLAAAGFGVP